jgi:hypothetical protein
MHTVLPALTHRCPHKLTQTHTHTLRLTVTTSWRCAQHTQPTQACSHGTVTPEPRTCAMSQTPVGRSCAPPGPKAQRATDPQACPQAPPGSRTSSAEMHIQKGVHPHPGHTQTHTVLHKPNSQEATCQPHKDGHRPMCTATPGVPEHGGQGVHAPTH